MFAVLPEHVYMWNVLLTTPLHIHSVSWISPSPSPSYQVSQNIYYVCSHSTIETIPNLKYLAGYIIQLSLIVISLNTFSKPQYLIFNNFSRCLTLKENFRANSVESCCDVNMNYCIYLFLRQWTTVNLWSATACSQEASHFGFVMNRLWICEFKAGSHGNPVLDKDFTEQRPCRKTCLVGVLQREGPCWAPLRALCGQMLFLNKLRFVLTTTNAPALGFLLGNSWIACLHLAICINNMLWKYPAVCWEIIVFPFVLMSFCSDLYSYFTYILK